MQDLKDKTIRELARIAASVEDVHEMLKGYSRHITANI